MAGREYQGAGGLRLHLDEPLSPQMAEQVSKGHLVPVSNDASAEPPATVDPADPDEPKRPTANAKVDDWRAYAVSLGMSEDEAQSSTKADLQEWVEVAENAQGAGE
ncbi:hypothetical protein ACIRLA_21940 [Streptomyces sp. NPDC102364]|uniref:hypothetical protein n=1 Tax=Streptomyces sp. NPDC102364 TaxID=3366161 RepID=UPI0038196CF7